MSDTGTKQDTPDTDDSSTKDESTPQNPPEKTFTQAQVEKIMGKEKNDGRRSVFQELGIDPADTTTIDEIKKVIQDKKPEAQKLAEQQIQQQEAIKQAQHRAFLAECKAELLAAGVQKEYIDDAMALLAVKKQDGMDITAEVESLKENRKFLFESPDDDDS
ncbi:MAG: hypothetical protein LBI05_04280, partial [Planctomycetaceae bacterium]|nr:hypothetical protein [Planctomycetaceae bacterium]